MTKHYIHADGLTWWGGFDTPPSGGIEVPIAPADARDTWDGSVWVAYVPPYTEARLVGPTSYASLADQIDMQYHDAVDGTSTWIDHIAAVKAAHPKPT